jgi:PAS domain S-box-containing protein
MSFEFENKTKEELIVELKSEISKRTLLETQIDLCSYTTKEQLKIKDLAIWESEEKYKHLFDNALVGMFRTRLSDGLFLEVNSMIADIIGLPVDEIVGKLNAKKLYKDKTKRNEFLKILNQYGEVHNFELAAILPSKKEMTISMYVKAYPHEDYMEGIVVDITELKKSREDNQKLATVVKQATDGMAMADFDGVLSFANLAWAKMHGYDSPEELLGKNLSMFHTDKQVKNEVTKSIELAMKNGSHIGEIGHLHKNGTEFPTQMTTTVIYDKNNKPLALVGTTQDITKQKIAIRNRKFLDQINTIIINANDLNEMLGKIQTLMLHIFSCDRVFLLFPVDPHAKTYTIPMAKSTDQWRPANILNQNIPLDPFTSQIFSHALKTNDTLTIGVDSDYDIPPELSDTLHVKSMMVIIAKPQSGKPWLLGLHQCSHDRIWTDEEKQLFKHIAWRITDGLSNMLLMEELTKTRNYLSNIINSMPSVMVGVDKNGDVTQWNKKAQNLSGVSSSKALGLSLAEVFPRLGEEMGKIQTAMKTRAIQSNLTKVYDKHVTAGYQNVTIYPLVENDQDGAVIKIDDVTSQIRLKERMSQSEKMHSVSNLASGMANEITEPLARLLQTSNYMINRFSNNNIKDNLTISENIGVNFDKILEFMDASGCLSRLKMINDTGEKIFDIVDNMVNFAATTDSVYLEYDIVELLNQTINLATSDYSLIKHYDIKEMKIITEYEKNLPLIYCNFGRIQQALLNIINNAVQAMSIYEKETGKKGIKTDAPSLTLRLIKEPESIRIEIEDNGPGMEKAITEQIFEPFFTTKSELEGAGLGLSVAHFIVAEHHKGTLTIETQPGKGSNFIITLPYKNPYANKP